MAKKESTFLNMTLTLLITTLVAGLSLGYINELTLEPKAQAKMERKVKALKQVLPDFTNNPVRDMQLLKMGQVKDSVEIYPAHKGETYVGTAVVGSSENGYSGLIKLMVGFDTEGNIINIVVLEQKETPGLGTKMKEAKFLDQFKGKNPSNFNFKPKKDGGDVDALTGATISTRAFGQAVGIAYEVYQQIKKD